jgi:hypothetical protein
MKWDFDKLESKLSDVADNLEKCEEELKKTTEEIFYNDESGESIDSLKDILGEESDYIIANKKYKAWIGSYSKAYIELSEYYYGDELPYHIYCREFGAERGNHGSSLSSNPLAGTYLASPEDVKVLYKLFIYYGMFECVFCS